MRNTYAALSAMLATALVVACSNNSPLGPVLYIIDGGCPSVPVALTTVDGGTYVELNGQCNLGQAGAYTLEALLPITIGACGTANVDISATWTASSTVPSTLYSTFVGSAFVGCDGGNIDVPNIPISGVFTFDGGTGPYTNATGSAITDGGVTVGGVTPFGPAVLTMTGELTY